MVWMNLFIVFFFDVSVVLRVVDVFSAGSVCAFVSFVVVDYCRLLV